MNAVKLYSKYTIEQLVAMSEEIRNDPQNKQDGLYLYTPAARRKMHEIDWAITYHLKDRREAAGDPVSTEGYSGRNSNRR